MKHIILVDLDGTVADDEWRLHYRQQGWDAYHKQGDRDQPIHDMVTLLRGLNTTFILVGLTSRPEKFRQLTTRWCVLNDIPLDEILMRPHDCYLPSPECKVLCMRERFGERWAEEVLFIIDDRDDVAHAFALHGVSTLTIKPRRPNGPE
jgi:phosphoglycolate phosphatase-like HAD superfamily hydrolase